MILFKKAINIASVILALAAVTMVIYGVTTSCPDVTVYVYCPKDMR